MISLVERTTHISARCVLAASLFWAAMGGWLAPAGKAAFAGSPSEGERAVRVISAPAGCFVPDTAIDAKGVLHMVYAKDRNAYYVRSTDNGATLSEPVRVNSAGRTVEFKMGERGPKLAVGGDGIVHVVWVDCWAPGIKTYARYARSVDHGMTFETMKTLSSINGVDGLTITAGGGGRVLAFWHVAQPPQNKIPQGTWLHVARSVDNGVNFEHDEQVRIVNHSGLACSMCMMRARTGADGNVYLAFRSAEENIRDFYVLKGDSSENRFTAIRVNEDNWLLKGCPMCGPELTVGADGRLLCAFMSRHKIYWSASDKEVGRFQGHAATPANEKDELYPTAVANRRGDVLLVWQVGPMSITGTATVHWACYNLAGKFTGRHGMLGRTTSGTKATAFVGSDDCFYIVTTAQNRI